MDELKLKPPLPGETEEQYIVRVNFETSSDNRIWCLVCGSRIRGDEWRYVHYKALHIFKGF